MNIEKNIKKLNKERGKRLKQVRESFNLTQSALAEIANYEHPNTISQLENGARNVTYEKIKPIADALGISAAFIMCESDSIKGFPVIHTDNRQFNKDELYIMFLLSRGYSIEFNCIFIYDSGQQEKVVPFDSLHNFSLDKYESKVKYDNKVHECIINKIIINGIPLSYSQFSFFIYSQYDYIDFRLESVNQFKYDLDMMSGTDSAMEAHISESGGLFDINTIRGLQIQENLKKHKFVDINGKPIKTKKDYIKAIESGGVISNEKGFDKFKKYSKD